MATPHVYIPVHTAPVDRVTGRHPCGDILTVSLYAGKRWPDSNWVLWTRGPEGERPPTRWAERYTGPERQAVARNVLDTATQDLRECGCTEVTRNA